MRGLDLLLIVKTSYHFHGLGAGRVTVLIQDYLWDIRPQSVDMTVMFRDQPSPFHHLGFSMVRRCQDATAAYL